MIQTIKKFVSPGLGHVCRAAARDPALPPALHGDPHLRAHHAGEDEGGEGSRHPS